MSVGKIKAAKIRVHQPPENAPPDAQFHVYIFDTFHRTFLPGRVFDTAEKAAAFQRHEQERIYTEQEAEPEQFDLPFLSSDPELVRRVERDDDYKKRLVRDLKGDARSRGRRH